ncbi:Rieske 2Fe-2S domain-containing protein [Croceicoccus sp. F390]|uniref:Rieske 2Fe-2S domain-containing protein n=1 Tax=Croceicoccus esteveae TaxID=3075597 RepID=A0ABU2ZF07_9SPHN|nr:Rieske 2Fe-2S domain-containing protein [Croceicoccus sp. F390]MDT0575182.1 Rieske 2Fe-2S domain-containing protein [Croceicoccus sp. F390]
MAKSADYRLGDFTFGRGWYMVADATKLEDAPMNLRYFARDLVLYRGESGTPHLVDAYCPHMGAHLGRNESSYIVRDKERIQGESIRCPFHGWRFGPDGRCDNIPYSDQKPPAAAKIGTYPVEERAGVIWMWFDEEGNEPSFDLPPLAMWDDPHWVQWKIDDLGELPQHPIEIVDNMTDMAHFTPIHGSRDIDYFYNEYDDHLQWQMFGAGHRTLIKEGDPPLELDTWYTGPGILQSFMRGEYPTHMLIAHTPVEDGVIHVWHALMVKFDHEATAEDVPAARAYQQASLDAFAQDFEIWSHKRACINPMMVRGDGPIDKCRLWYKQFYNPIARAGEFHSRLNGRIVMVDNRKPEDIPVEKRLADKQVA